MLESKQNESTPWSATLQTREIDIEASVASCGIQQAGHGELGERRQG